MSVLTFREFLQIGRDEWRVHFKMLVRHYTRDYRGPFHPDRQQWVTRRNRLLRHYVRGPLGIHRRIRHARVINAIQRLDLLSDARILDAGCGHAYAALWLAQHYPDYTLEALEFDAQLVDSGKRNASAMGLDNMEFCVGSIRTLNKVDTYDLIMSLDVLEHIPDDVGTLRAFRRALRAEGWLLLHLPRRHQEHRRFFPAFKNHTTPEHVRDEYTEEEIRARLRHTGFRVEYVRYGFSMLGELAFELNNLFWERLPLRLSLAFLFHPLCVLLAYADTRWDYYDGNSLLVLARPN